MLCFLLCLFSDFFPSETATLHKLSDTRVVVNSGNHYIHSSIFNGLTFSSGAGGAIYISSCDHTVVENCIFSRCSSSNGGAMKVSSSESVVNRCCGSFCSAPSTVWTNGGQFSDIIAGKNIFLLSSVFQCPESTVSGAEVSIGIRGSTQEVKNINASSNEGQSYSGILFNGISSSICDYCTFHNCTTRNYVCIVYIGNGAGGLFKNSNIVGNKSPHSSWGVFYAESTTNVDISGCVFIGNTNVLLTTSASAISVKNTWIDHSGTLTYKFSGSINLDGSVSYKSTSLISADFLDMNGCSSLIRVNNPSMNAKNTVAISIFIFSFQIE